MEIKDLLPNKIYSVTWCSTQIVGRYKEVKCNATCQHTFYDCLHYWNSHECFYSDQTVYLSNADEIREASKAEKLMLVKYEIDNSLI